MEGESGAPGGGGGQRRRVRPRAAVAVMRGGGWIRGGTRRTKPGAAGPLLPQRDRDNQRDARQRRVELTERMRPLRPQGSLPSTDRFQLLCAKQAQRGTHQLCSCRVAVGLRATKVQADSWSWTGGWEAVVLVLHCWLRKWRTSRRRGRDWPDLISPANCKPT